MANKMLIDASHPEETRVVVLRGNRIEEFDFESASKKPLRGNIYLAKVTRVEPSLQAAFIEYGGNRHGFLAFSEIHPDYYQIPVADRQALLEEEQRQQRDEEEEEHRGGGNNQRRSRRNRRSKGGRSEKRASNDETMTGEVASPEDGDAPHSIHDEPRVERNGDEPQAFVETAAAPEGEGEARPGEWTPLDAPAPEPAAHDEQAHEAPASDVRAEAEGAQTHESAAVEALDGDRPRDAMEHEQPHHDDEHAVEARSPNEDESEDDEEEDEDEEEEHVEQLGGDDTEEMPVRSTRQRKQYKIQEVIRRRQVLLVQVVKEERGNKGAALTTYLSLAGRYSVLMPNTARGGGISRKITD
ncbi:MAG: rne, partial [Hyphomicrobiales bacterium]|nr:rne [Hyphomicrobiales bacterium]